MLHWNELRITPDNKYLIIDVSVDNDSYYDNIVLDSIVIDTQDTYVLNGPSSNPIYTFNVDDSHNELHYQTYVNEEGRHIRLTLNHQNLNTTLDGNMFFVYAIATGTPAPDTPCGFDSNQIMGTVVNLYPIYQNIMCYIKKLNNKCEVPKEFIDMILRLKSVELCVRTGNYPQAIKYWNKFFSTQNYKVPNYNCGCYGRGN